MSNPDQESPTNESQASGEVSVCVHTPETEGEARGVESFRNDEGQPCTLVSFRDTAYPGIVDRQRIWGEVRVPAGDQEKAKALVVAWLSAEPVGDLEQAAVSAAYPAIEDAGPARIRLPVLVIGAVFILAALTASKCL